MAISKISNGGKFPEGFVPPFKRVQMEERNDDSLACIATLSGRTMPEITKLAVNLGYPPNGPAWVENALITRVLNAVGLVGGEYQEVKSIDALPWVAILMVDYNAKTDIGRHVVWHHLKASDTTPSFHYIIDPAQWIEPAQQITTDFRHIKLDAPLYYIEVTPKAGNGGKTK
jgi:hypothetical protein